MIIKATITSTSGRILTDVVRSQDLAVTFQQRRWLSPLAWSSSHHEPYVCFHILDPEQDNASRVTLMPGSSFTGFTDASATWPEGGDDAA